MSIPLPDARELSDEVLEALRLRALRGCELGFTEAEVADLLGACRETGWPRREALRLRARRGGELGFTEAEVADLLGVCRETVCHWWSAYTRGGLAALPHER